MKWINKWLKWFFGEEEVLNHSSTDSNSKPYQIRVNRRMGYYSFKKTNDF